MSFDSLSFSVNSFDDESFDLQPFLIIEKKQTLQNIYYSNAKRQNKSNAKPRSFKKG